jgi:hypothetical protein
MESQLAGDSTGSPLFNVVVVQYPRFNFEGQSHKCAFPVVSRRRAYAKPSFWKHPLAVADLPAPRNPMVDNGRCARLSTGASPTLKSRRRISHASSRFARSLSRPRMQGNGLHRATSRSPADLVFEPRGCTAVHESLAARRIMLQCSKIGSDWGQSGLRVM